MKRKVVVAVALLASTAISGLALASVSAARRTPAVSINPGSGSPTTRFAVSFVAPVRTGSYDGLRHSDVLSATGPASASGCTSDISQLVRVTRVRDRVRVVLDPRHMTGRRWCVGTFHGEIDQLESPVCPMLELCPAYVIVLGRIGRFTFHVTARG